MSRDILVDAYLGLQHDHSARFIRGKVRTGVEQTRHVKDFTVREAISIDG